MSHQEDYRRIRAAIVAATNQGIDEQQIAWTVVNGIAAIIDGATGKNIAGTMVGALTSIKDGISLTDSIDTTPNPWFVWNGHADDDADTSYTRKYLRRRAIKGFGGGLVGLVGVASSQATHVDVAGILMHSNAVASTSIHLIKLKAIGAGYKQSETITGWIDLLIKMKGFKAAIRGTQLAGSAIPVGAVGILTGIGAAAAKIGVCLTYTKVCAMTSANIHWRAYQEQAISGGRLGQSGKVGPASDMMYEIFCRRGGTRVCGKYDVDRIIREPTGWMCLNDKMMLL